MRRVTDWRRVGCAVLVLACACRRQAGEGEAPTRHSEQTTPSLAVPAASYAEADIGSSREQSATGFTAGIIEREASPQGIALLSDVRFARHEGFDRLVFEFAEGPLPGYHVEYIDKPVRQCGSGATTPIAGDAWLEVRFSPANAHTPSGAPTIAFREKKLDLQVVKELEQTCDFEAHVTWVLGAARPNPYRVLTLESPVRLVVDVQR